MTIGGNTKVRIFYRSVRSEERGKFGQTPQCDATLSEIKHAPMYHLTIFRNVDKFSVKSPSKIQSYVNPARDGLEAEITHLSLN